MRKIRIFNDDWRFVKAAGDAAGAARIAGESGEKIALPHTWNAVDGQDGGNDYHRGTCWYVKQFERPILTEGEEAWLEFRDYNMESITDLVRLVRQA